MESKQCSKCREVKPLSEYNPDKNIKTGLRAQCKECQYAVQRNRYKREFFKVQAKERAREAFNRGEIQKPLFCEICGQIKKLDRHHPDYSKPLKIMWICRKCHKNIKIA